MSGSQRRKERKKEKRKKERNNKQQTSSLHVARPFSKTAVTQVVIKLLYLDGNLGFIAFATKAYQIYINKELSVSSILKF